ncbi:MAG: aldo/keto reductase [Porticoccaceae bacterium]
MTQNNPPSLSSYSLLGRSGLRVSPLCLGTMTFGNDWGWGADAAESRRIFDRYLDAGGNFIDTANTYTNGNSEKMLGDFMASTGNRERIVLATKFTITTSPGDPNATGNGRKNIYRALEASLQRLKTDYIDLYWMHMWDGITPVEEVVETLDNLVREGKIRYFGLSDVPAWYLARAQTIAELRGNAKVAALQLEYSLTDRNIEREHVPAALEMGMGICPWSPLASGFLSGKYSREKDGMGSGQGRMTTDVRFHHQFTERNWKILDVVQEAASVLGKTPSQVALNWITKRPGITSTIIGASKLSQLEDNLAALEFDIPAELSQKLEDASKPGRIHLYDDFFAGEMQAAFRAANISKQPGWFGR